MLAEAAFDIPLNKTFYYFLPEEMELKAAPGLRMRARLGKRTATGIIIRVIAEKDADLSGFGELKPVLSIMDEYPLFSRENILETARWISGRWGSPMGQCLSAFYAHAPETARTSGSDFIFEKKENGTAPFPEPLSPEAVCDGKEIMDEKALLARANGKRLKGLIKNSFNRKAGIFAEYTAASLEAGSADQALLLCPDRTLFAVYKKALLRFFKEEEICQWHGTLTPAKRKENWEKIFRGQARVILGTRTSVFLPFARLKTAVVDEEESEVYSQDETGPYYNAREILSRRSEELNSSLLLSSEFPSAESWGRGLAGEMELYSVKTEEENTAAPVTVKIDMRKSPGELIASGLKDYLRETVVSGKKGLVITERKGYASLLFCASCSAVQKCPKCGSGLTVSVRNGKNSLRCPRCGRTYVYPEKCPACGGKVFNGYGIGTQRAEEIMKNFLPPGTRICRLDGDTLKNSVGAAEKSIKDFTKGEARLLIGTKIALRTLGNCRIDFAAFLNTDNDISPSDFRAAEKAVRDFKAVCGLMNKGGKIFIQTRDPGNFILSQLENPDYASFMKNELEGRKAFLYPPYSLLMKIDLISCSGKKIEQAAGDIFARLKFLNKERSGEIIGPVDAARNENSKILHEYYLVKTFSGKAADRAFRAVSGISGGNALKIKIKPDPYNF